MKGQIAQEFQIALLIMMLFTTALLAVEMPMLQKITDKQITQYEQTKNIHNCALNDILTIYHTQGIQYNPTNGTCLTTNERTAGSGIIQIKKENEFG